MVVNSFQFLAFFIVVFVVYYLPWMRQAKTRQNVWLLLTSYFFYGFVDWRMLPILLAVTIVFFFIGKVLRKYIDEGKTVPASRLTTTGVLIGIGILFYFKYLNFFADSVVQLLQSIGFGVSWSTLNIVLPVGVSFFTFKLICYVIEVHREKIMPSEDFLEFATYIAFFPTIMSGPIDRPGKFLPQLRKAHSFDFNLAMDGCQQILWGIFTKMVIADNLSSFTSEAWSSFGDKSSWELVYAVILSPLQVYADFDGYSNMAIGVGKILGFNITKNFDHPLLARNVSEYWRRWHISLTTWITDYVFMPLNVAFRNLDKLGIWLAITINLVVIGLWHGANWTYAVFGIYHSLLFIPLIWSGSFGKNKKLKEGKYGLPRFSDFLLMILTYVIIGFGHIIFFAKDVPSWGNFMTSMYAGDWSFVNPLSVIGIRPLLYMALLFVIEWITRKKEFAIQRSSLLYSNKVVRLFVCDLLLALSIAVLGSGSASAFIYFQF